MWDVRSNFESLLALMAALLLAGACAPIPRSVETPIPTRIYGDVTKAEEIFVLLPGVHDTMATFEERGFIAASDGGLAEPGRAAFVAVDAHLGYYQERSIERRLYEEVLGPTAGKRVTAVGISLGGLGVLVTARRYPDLFDRVVLIAPFLGWSESIQELKQSANPIPRDEMEADVFALWRWLVDGADGIPITLLYGQDDRFRAAYMQLELRAPHITFRGGKGAHNWPTWNALWADWLSTGVAEVHGFQSSAPSDTDS